MRWLFNTIILMISSCYLYGIEYNKNIFNPFIMYNSNNPFIVNHKLDEIIYFNIGGYKMDIKRHTIYQFGGTYLNQLINNILTIKDREGRIFIDRPKEEGKIVAHYIRTQQYPPNVDKNIIKNTAKFFDIESLKKMIKNRRKDKKKRKYSEYKVYNYIPDDDTCIYCNYKSDSISSIAAHLLNSHNAKIVSILNSRNNPTIIYRIPQI